MGWARFLRRGRWDAERARELESHLAIETDENIARGMAPDEARWAAERRLGNVLRIREEIYRMNTVGLLESAWCDLRCAGRFLRRAPGFTAVAVLSLVLGIGANTAIFQLIDAVRLRTLPVSQPEQLVQLHLAGSPQRAGNFYGWLADMTYPLWEQIRTRQEAFSDVGAWGAARFDLASGGEVRRAEGLYVSGSFFEMLGVRAALGRVLGAADDRPGCRGGAVISHRFWQQEYGGDRAVLGRTLRLAGHAFDVIGVTPPTFHGVEVGKSFDVALPICAAPTLEPDADFIEGAHVWWLSVMGRLRPDWSVARATAHLRAMSPSVFERTLSTWFDPEAARQYRAFTLEAVLCAGGVSMLRGQYGTALWFLFGLSGLVLLATCVNVANLLLARAGGREREVGVRLATGASRARVVRHLVTESLLLTALGTIGGVALARVLSGMLVRLISADRTPFVVDLPMDWRVLGFAIATVAVTTLACGLAPALRATASPVARLIKAGGRTGTVDRGQRRLQAALVTAQVALSMVMVGSAAYFALSLRNLMAVDTGHRPDGLWTVDLELGRLAPSADRIPVLHRTLRERLEHTPGIESVVETAIPPMAGMAMADDIRIDSRPSAGAPTTSFHRVGPGFFKTAGVPLVAGRDFDDRDSLGAPHVAIVNRTFAARLLNTPSALGQVFRLQTTPGTWTPYRIVGVAEDAIYANLRDPVPPVAYLARAQEEGADRDVRFLVHSRLQPEALRASVTRAVAEVSPSISVDLVSIADFVRRATRRERVLAVLSGAFGSLALILSIVGIYGVMAYLVARRRQEIGVRLVLGASRMAIVGMVARRSLAWLGTGLLIGSLLALAAAVAARSMLFGLTPTDPTPIVVAAVLLALSGLAAAVVPALGAARLEPTGALREE